MNIITIGADRFYHPENENQIQDLILYAIENNLKVRVRGAAHSIRDAIYTGNRNTNNGIDIILDKMSNVFIDKQRKQVTVQAGCHLGMDPFDMTGRSDIKNSLFYQMDQAGLAVPDMGGIIHQTVGGFLSTGSAGGSVQHSFGEQLIALKFIDGNGEIHYVTRDENDDLFFAAGISMGLLGIITEATFQCVDAFNVIGEETTTTIDDCSIDLFGDGKYGRPGIEDFLRNTEYARLMWWPQKKVRRIVIWKARRMQPPDYKQGTAIGGNGNSPESRDTFTPKPYLEFPLHRETELSAETAGGLFYTIVGNWHQAVKKYRISFPLKTALSFIAWLYPSHILPAVIKDFVPLDIDKQPQGPQKFWDTWWLGLPMDNRINDRIMPTEFTEIWIPLSKAGYVMTKLRELYDSKGYKATGSYSCEIYAAKKSDFWLSPSYHEDVIRINIFWYGYNAGKPVECYYPQFWKLFINDETLTCRFHWGKYMPVNPEYLRQHYPRWNDFFALREKLDPNRIFVTDYWAKHLGI
jgi:hypothetical protein